MVDHVNIFTQGTSMYPKHMTDAYNQVVNYKRQCVPSSTRHKTTPSHILSSNSELDEKSEDEVAFAQYANSIRCFNCVELGHYKGSK